MLEKTIGQILNGVDLTDYIYPKLKLKKLAWELMESKGLKDKLTVLIQVVLMVMH